MQRDIVQMSKAKKYNDWYESNIRRRWQIAVFVFVAAVLIVFALCVSGCKTCVPIVETIEKERIVEIHTHDTAIVTKADSAQVKLLLRCDSANNVLIDQICAAHGERLRMELQLQALATGGIAWATIDCKEDSLLQIIQWQDSVIRESTNHTIVQNVEVVPQYYKNCHLAMWILVAIIALYIAIRIIIKIYLKR